METGVEIFSASVSPREIEGSIDRWAPYPDIWFQGESHPKKDIVLPDTLGYKGGHTWPRLSGPPGWILVSFPGLTV